VLLSMDEVGEYWSLPLYSAMPSMRTVSQAASWSCVYSLCRNGEGWVETHNYSSDLRNWRRGSRESGSQGGVLYIDGGESY
jgi:hypothetical protein